MGREVGPCGRDVEASLKWLGQGHVSRKEGGIAAIQLCKITYLVQLTEVASPCKFFLIKSDLLAV